MNNAILFGALFVGLSVFHGLGALGVGSDLFAEYLSSYDFSSMWSERLSKALLGIFAGGAAFFLTWGHITDRDGKIVDLCRD